jgi:hypothetical protein
MNNEELGKIAALHMGDELEKIAIRGIVTGLKKGFKRMTMPIVRPSKLKSFDDLMGSEDKVLRSFKQGTKYRDKKLLSQAKTRQRVHTVRSQDLNKRSQNFMRQYIQDPTKYQRQATLGKVPDIKEVEKVLDTIGKQRVPRFFKPKVGPSEDRAKSPLTFDKLMRNIGIGGTLGGVGYLGLKANEQKQIAEAQDPYSQVYGY